MNQTFLQLLAKNAKDAGLPVAEELAEQLYKAFTKTATQFAAQSSNSLIKTIVPVAVKALDEVALEMIDKIDSSDDQAVEPQ